MNLDFTDPNLLIDDFAFPESSTKHRTRLKSLKIPESLQKALLLQNAEIVNASVQLEENSITTEVEKIFNTANQARTRLIRYQKVNGSDYLYCDGGNPHRPHSNGIKERQKYIKAAKHLLDLLKEKGVISISPNQQKRFTKFRENYRTQCLWIEFYMLENLEVLTELGFKRPTNRQYRPGKISAKFYELVLDMWAEAKTNGNHLCEWILNFDSPAQIWFALEATLITDQWDNPQKNGYQIYQSEKLILERLNHYQGKTVDLIYSKQEEENVLTLTQAFEFTLLKLLESGIEPDNYQAYLKARTAQANRLRKGEPGKRSNSGFGA